MTRRTKVAVAITALFLFALTTGTIFLIRRQDCDRFEREVVKLVPSYPSLVDADLDTLAQLFKEQPARCDVLVPVVG
jgi:hypothetical protein